MAGFAGTALRAAGRALGGEALTGFDAGFKAGFEAGLDAGFVDFPFDEPEPFDEFANEEAGALPALALDEVEAATD